MIKILRRKFILISVASVFAVLVMIAGTINIVTYIQMEMRARNTLTLLSDNDGSFPKPEGNKGDFRIPKKMEKDPAFSTPYFSIIINDAGKIGAANVERMHNLTIEDAASLSVIALSKDKDIGAIGQLRYQVTQKTYGTLIVFIDCGRDIEMFYTFLSNSIVISIVGVTAVFFLILIFSNKAIAPVVESYEKQKQFITDASHELKTPLAIISTNAEVLEIDYGESEWTKSIRNQVERLAEMVTDLVTLTRMDEEKWQIHAVDFSLTDAVMETAEPFQVICETRNKSLVLDIEEHLSYFGDEETIRQLISILLENAVKYGREKSVIQLSLKKQGKKYVIEVCNEADNLQKGKLDVYFERFYRADTSHNSQTGGHGIGLSIAKAIVKKHKGKIHAYSPDGERIIITAKI